MTPLRLLGQRGKLLEVYRRMVLVRTFDETTRHSPAGCDLEAENAAAAAAAALDPEDYAVTPDGGHRLALARGIAPEAVITGLFSDVRARAAWRVVTGGLRAATDLAPALRLGARHGALLCVPGAASPAAIARAFEIAARRWLPVVFLVHGTHPRLETAAADVHAADLGAVHQATARLLARARAGAGPAVLEAVSEGLPAACADPLSLTAARLAELGATPEDLLDVAAVAEERITTALERVSADTVSTLVAATGAARESR